MSIIVKHNHLLFNILFFLILALKTVSAASGELPLILQTENREVICVGKSADNDFSSCSVILNRNSTDKKTEAMRRRSDEFIYIFSKPIDAGHYFAVVARIPSKLPQGTGYCGAGYEDHLILLEYRNKKITLRDDFLLQSCLRLISLSGDGDNDILKLISVDLKNYLIQFKWLSDPEDRAHIVTISNGKFILN